MRARVEGILDRLRASFWFIPAVLTAGSILLAFVMLWLDGQIIAAGGTVGGPFVGGPEGARTLLATAAASMITVSGVVFSIAIVAMTLASIQFGPRILRNFMRDVGSQAVLGTFVATFLFCLLVLRAIPDRPDDPLPNISIGTAIVLVVASVAVLIYFIHHAAAIIQVGSILSTAARDLDANVDVLYPEQLGHGPAGTTNAATFVPPDLETNSREIVARGLGYVDAVDTRTLMHLAAADDLVIRLDVRPGSFVEPGVVVGRAWPVDRVDDHIARRLADCLLVSAQRTTRQDVEFAIQQLVQVAVRALSPAINDPWTAYMCLDRLGAALTRLAERDRPSRYRLDAAGRLRVIADAAGFDALASQALTEIRFAGRANLTVTVRLLETISLVARQTSWDDELAALRRHADRVEAGSRDTLREPWERRVIETRHQEAIAAIEASLTQPASPG
jgi:uncharacterized membrane protein